jgi:hypothetical protein
VAVRVIDVAGEREVKRGVCRVNEGFIGDPNALTCVGEEYDLLREFSHDRDSLPMWIDSERRTRCAAANTA